MVERQSVTKRSRTVRESPPIPDVALKHTNYAAYIRKLVRHVITLPAHDDERGGWWCCYSALMSELISYLAHPDVQDTSVWHAFRDNVANQLALCRKCARNYHTAVARWEQRDQVQALSEQVTPAKLAALTTWDISRLVPPLKKVLAVSKSSDPHVRLRDAIKAQCREAVLEAILSARICMDSRFSKELGEVFRQNSPVRNKEDMAPFVSSLGSIPPGLLILCFHDAITVRTWATRLYSAFVRCYNSSDHTLQFLLRGAAESLSHEVAIVGDCDSSNFFANKGSRTLWDGLSVLICGMQDDSMKSFVKSGNSRDLVDVLFTSLENRDDSIVALASDCIYKLLGSLPFSALFTSGGIPPDGLLDIVMRSFDNPERLPSSKHRLLDLLAPVLASAKKSGHGSVSRLFRKCFDFLFEGSKPKLEVSSSSSWLQVNAGGDISSADVMKTRRAVMKTGASLLNWYYSHRAPNLPFEDVKKISMFVINVLREDPDSERGWDLLRTVLLTDVFNLIRCMKEEKDVELIGATFLAKRPADIALRPEEDAIMEKVINIRDGEGDKVVVKPVITWVGELWKYLRAGKHIKGQSSWSQSELGSTQEMKIMLDLHRLIGMVSTCDISSASPAMLQDQTNSKAGLDKGFIVSCVKEVQDTIFERLDEACKIVGEQNWWRQLPFHATHLLSSSRKEVANKTFEALLKSKKLLDANCAGSHSKLLAHVLKNDSDAAEMMADGCVSCMRMIAALGSTVSLRTYPCFLLWYRVLVDSRYVSLLEKDSNRASNWALGVILNFIRTWRRAEEVTKAAVFSEVCCRFLSNLREVWKKFYKVTDPQAGKGMSQIMLEKAIVGLFGMNRLKDPTPRAAWVHTICILGHTWKDKEEYRSRMSDIIGNHARKRGPLSLEQCMKLSSSLGLVQVEQLLNLWSDEEVRKKKLLPSRKATKTTTIDQFFGKNASRTPTLSQGKSSGVVKDFSTKTFALRGQPTKDVPKWETRSRPLNKPAGLIHELRRETRASKKDNVRRPPLSARNESGGEKKEKEKTKMEKLVEQSKAERDKRLAENPIEIDMFPQQAQAGQSNAGPAALRTESSLLRSMKRSGPDRRMQRAETERRSDAVDEERERLRLPLRRRHMEKRSIEQTHRALLSMKLSPDLREEKFGRFEGRTPSRFEDVEEYVRYWEPIIVAEFHAQVLRVALEERTVAEGEKRSGEYSSCRTLFEVEAPVEAVGYVQTLSLLFADANTQRSTSQSGESEFDVARAQTSDLVLLEIAPAKFQDGSEGIGNMAYSLGIVTGTSRKKGILGLKLNVAFEGLDTVPGKGRQMRVSRLTGLTTFQRQIDGLWALPSVSDAILRTILDPLDGWTISQRVQKRIPSTAKVDMEAEMAFVRQIQTDGSLNESQANAVQEVVLACAPLFRRVDHQTTGLNYMKSVQSSLTLIQGPPGTGKTSTVIALLSTLLNRSMQSSKFRRAQVHLDDGPVRVHLAPIRILVCAPSNAAVDEIMSRVMEDGLLLPSGSHAVPRLVRVGAGTTLDKIQKLELKTLAESQRNYGGLSSSAEASKQINKRLDELQEVNSKICVVDKERRELVDARGAEASLQENIENPSASAVRYRQLTKQLTSLHERKNQINSVLTKEKALSREEDASRKRENTRVMCNVLNSASLVFATLSSSGHESLRSLSAKFDVVVVDEAAQCGEPEALIPICGQGSEGHKSKSSHVVLVGDPKQLPATVISTLPGVGRALGRSLFERVGEVPKSPLHMLTTQYRMHPHIAAFPNFHFYGDRLLNGPNVTSEGIHRAFHLDRRNRFGPISFIDTSVSQCSAETRGAGGSLYNQGEARVVIAAIVSLVRIYGLKELVGNIVILSPYRQQVSLLRRMASASLHLRNAKVEVSTIDGIQGREKSIVVLSTVRSGTHGGIGFVDDSRRMNVAITRAKHSLIIVGHARALSRYSELWSSLLSQWGSRARVLALSADAHSLFPESRHNARVPSPPKFPPPEGLPDLKRANFRHGVHSSVDSIKLAPELQMDPNQPKIRLRSMIPSGQVEPSSVAKVTAARQKVDILGQGGAGETTGQSKSVIQVPARQKADTLGQMEAKGTAGLDKSVTEVPTSRQQANVSGQIETKDPAGLNTADVRDLRDVLKRRTHHGEGVLHEKSSEMTRFDGSREERSVYRRVVPRGHDNATRQTASMTLTAHNDGGRVSHTASRGYANGGSHGRQNVRNDYPLERESKPFQQTQPRRTRGQQEPLPAGRLRQRRPPRLPPPNQRGAGPRHPYPIPPNRNAVQGAFVGRAGRPEEEGRLLAKHRNKRPRPNSYQVAQPSGSRNASGAGGRPSKRRKGTRPPPQASSFSLTQSQQQMQQTQDKARRANRM